MTNVNTRTHTKNTMLNDAMLNMDSNKFYIVCACTCERETAGVHANSFVCLFVYPVGSDVAMVAEYLQWSVGSYIS